MRTARWIARRLRFLLLLLPLLLGLTRAPVAASESGTLEPTGTPHRVTLPGTDPVHVFAVPVPTGTRRLHAVVVAPSDVDLALHDSVLADGELDRARVEAISVSMVEHAVLKPETGGAFDAGRTLYVHVLNPARGARDLVASVAVWAETDTPVLGLSKGRNVTIPPGERGTPVDVVIPRGVSAARIRAQTRHGVPSLSATLAGVEVPALRRRRDALLSMTGRPFVPAGVWRLDVGRPEGGDGDEACVVRLNASLVPDLPHGEARAPATADTVLLQGPRGEKTLTLEESGWANLLLDVPPATRSVRIEATMDGGDVDLYAARNLPVHEGGAENWLYAAWRAGPREILFLGGTDSVASGLYWLGLSHVDGKAGTVRLTWESRDTPLEEDERPSTRGCLDGEVRDIRLAANEPAAWWDLPPWIGPGATVRALGADKDVDLLLVRTDTGAVVARGTTALHAETLAIPADLVVPEGVGLRLGLCRWEVTGAVAAGQVAVYRSAPPPPPSSYFPPYKALPSDARGRTLAAAVHLDTDEGTGSGIVVAPTGLLLTSWHVIDGLPADEDLLVSFPTRPRGRPRQLYRARVVDTSKVVDLALIELTHDVFGRPVPASRRLPFVPIGHSRVLELETPLRIVGYSYSASTSFLSNLHVVGGTLVGVEMEGDREVWLLTDARLAAGSSGAGTFDPRGQLVGIHWGSIGDAGSELEYATPVSAIPAAWRERIRAEGGQVPP